MTEFEQAFQDFTDLFLTNLPFLLTAIVILSASIFLGNLIKRLIKTKIQRFWKEHVMRNFIAEILKWVIILIGLISALNIIGVGNIAGSLMAGAGVSALIVGFAFKDIAENFLAGIILAINRPFSINDIIEVDKYKGPVKNLFLRVTHIRTADGKDIYIPNSIVIKNVFINYTKDGILRHDYFIRVEIADNISKARKLTLDLLEKDKDVLKVPAPLIQVEEIHESRVLLKVMFWVNFVEIRRNFDNSSTGESIKSRVIGQTKEVLLKHGCIRIPSYVLEHSMFNEESLDVTISKAKTTGESPGDVTNR